MKANQIGPDIIGEWLRHELRVSQNFSVQRVAPNVFRISGEALAETLAVKICYDHETGDISPTEAAIQYHSLVTIAPYLDRFAKNSVPKVFPFLRDHACLVTQWVIGEALNRYWRDWRKTEHQLVESAARAGDWLRSFHECRRLPDRPLDLDELIERLRQLHGQANAAFKSAPPVKAGMQLLSDLSHELKDVGIAAAWLHGDFKPANVILSAEKVFGIDISLYHEGAVVHDLVHFLLELNLMCLEPLTCRLSRIRRQMEDGFIAGYSRNEQFLNRLALSWRMLHLALCIWAARERRNTRTMRNWFLRRNLRLVATRLTRELENRT